MIAGTGIETLDNSKHTIPDDKRVWTVIKPPKVIPRFFTEAECGPDNFDTIDCFFTGVTFESAGRKVEVWAPTNVHYQVQREAEILSQHLSEIKVEGKPEPEPSVKTVELDSELDGDEWDLDSEEEDEAPSFEDWWFGQQERVADEVEKKIADQLKATLLWQGPLDPKRDRSTGFNIIRDMGS